MSYSRGSSLIEVIVAMLIMGFAISATLRMVPFGAATSLRRSISNLLVLKTIQNELQRISDTADPAIASPRVVPNIADEIGSFSAITQPMLGSSALVGAIVSHNPDEIEFVKQPIYGLSFSTVRFSSNEPTAAIGCTPTSCVELICANNSCRLSSKSLLLDQDERKLPFLSVIYPATEVSVLYQSERASLRKILLIDGRITSNQPILDGVQTFVPAVSTPANFLGAVVLEAIFSSTNDPSRLLSTSAVQRVVAPYWAIEFLTFGGL